MINHIHNISKLGIVGIVSGKYHYLSPIELLFSPNFSSEIEKFDNLSIVEHTIESQNKFDVIMELRENGENVYRHEDLYQVAYRFGYFLRSNWLGDYLVASLAKNLSHRIKVIDWRHPFQDCERTIILGTPIWSVDIGIDSFVSNIKAIMGTEWKKVDFNIKAQRGINGGKIFWKIEEEIVEAIRKTTPYDRFFHEIRSYLK